MDHDGVLPLESRTLLDYGVEGALTFSAPVDATRDLHEVDVGFFS